MKKLIELGASIDTAICAADEYDGGYNFGRDRKIRNALMALPTVDAVPVRHGRWIRHVDDLFPAESTQECDQCHEEQPLTCDDNYCPNCGAKMDWKDGEGNG